MTLLRAQTPPFVQERGLIGAGRHDNPGGHPANAFSLLVSIVLIFFVLLNNMHYIVSTLEVASCCVESRCANKITKIQTMFVGVWYVCCVRVCVHLWENLLTLLCV